MPAGLSIRIPDKSKAFIKPQVEAMFGKSATELKKVGRNERGVLEKVQLFQIKDPGDPCLKFNNYALSCQYGVMAMDDIPAGTVIGEYIGHLYREGESNADWGALPAFGFALPGLALHCQRLALHCQR